jgi:hypothetical protein
MADQLIRRSQFAPNEIVHLTDLTRLAGGGLAAIAGGGLADLTLAMRSALLGAGVTGILQASDPPVQATDPPSMQLLVPPLFAIDAAGLIIVESLRTIGPLANADQNLPRIDLVSIRYDEQAGTLEPRAFINADGQQYSNPALATEIIANPVITITRGQAAENPVAPDLPAGDLALATILVGAGVNSITSDKITTVATSRIDRVRGISTAVTLAHAVPWLSDGLQVNVPAGRQALLLGHIHGSVPSPSTPPDQMTMRSPVLLSIVDSGAPTVGLAFGSDQVWAFPNGAIVAPIDATVVLPLTGPVSSTFKLRVICNAIGLDSWNVASFRWSFDMVL